MTMLTRQLIKNDCFYLSPHWTVMMSTGPMYVYHRYLEYPCKPQISLLPVTQHKNFFIHEGAGTWYKSWDSYIVFSINQFYRHNRSKVTSIIYVVCVILFVCIIMKCKKKKIRVKDPSFNSEKLDTK